MLTLCGLNASNRLRQIISKYVSMYVHDLYSAKVLEESGCVKEDILGEVGS